MSELSHNVDKKLVLASGRAHPELAEEVAAALGTELLPMSAYDFANGEIYVRSGRVRARQGRLCHPGAPGTAEQLADGAADHG